MWRTLYSYAICAIMNTADASLRARDILLLLLLFLYTPEFPAVSAVSNRAWSLRAADDLIINIEHAESKPFSGGRKESSRNERQRHISWCINGNGQSSYHYLKSYGINNVCGGLILKCIFVRRQ